MWRVSALIDDVANGKASALVEMLRDAEAADPRCARYPRFGTSDDATVLHLRR